MPYHISSCSRGLVGYDDRLTRDRSRVRFSVGVLLFFCCCRKVFDPQDFDEKIFLFCNTRFLGLVGYDVRLTRGRSPVRFREEVRGTSSIGRVRR